VSTRIRNRNFGTYFEAFEEKKLEKLKMQAKIKKLFLASENKKAFFSKRK